MKINEINVFFITNHWYNLHINTNKGVYTMNMLKSHELLNHLRSFCTDKTEQIEFNLIIDNLIILTNQTNEQEQEIETECLQQQK